MNEAKTERQRAQARARYHRRKATDPDKIREQSRRSSQAHRDRNPGKTRASSKQRVRRWRQEHPDKERAKVRRRRERVAGSTVQVDADWIAVLEADPCAYCGGPGGSVDHISSLAHGGDGAVENLTGCCSLCNSRKTNLSLLDFLLR